MRQVVSQGLFAEGRHRRRMRGDVHGGQGVFDSGQCVCKRSNGNLGAAPTEIHTQTQTLEPPCVVWRAVHIEGV